LRGKKRGGGGEGGEGDGKRGRGRLFGKKGSPEQAT